MICTWVTRWGVALAIVLPWRSASAQPTPPDAGQPADGDRASRPAVVPPRLVHDPGVSYPPAALQQGFYDRVAVDLILELNDSGVVVDAKLEHEASAPFA